MEYSNIYNMLIAQLHYLPINWSCLKQLERAENANWLGLSCVVVADGTSQHHP